MKTNTLSHFPSKDAVTHLGARPECLCRGPQCVRLCYSKEHCLRSTPTAPMSKVSWLDTWRDTLKAWDSVDKPR